jgi:hypothetical protein
VSGCGEVYYCRRNVDLTVCRVAVRLCSAVGMCSDCVSGCGEVMYCWRNVN